MAYEDRFRKYQLVDVRIAKAPRDSRPESYRPNLASLRLGEVLPTRDAWRQRWSYLEDLAGATTACELNARYAAPDAASLGLVKVARVEDLIIEANEEYSAGQKAAAEMAAAEDLFGKKRAVLEPAPLRMKYRWFCTGDDCRGHTQTNIDWEAGQSVRQWAADCGGDEEQLRAKLRQKWLEQVCSPARDTYFYLGNQAKRPNVFAILGVFWPPAGSRPEPGLF